MSDPKNQPLTVIELPNHIASFCEETLCLFPQYKHELMELTRESRERGEVNHYLFMRLEAHWYHLRFYAEAVDHLLTRLNREERQLVAMHYFMRMPRQVVCEKMDIDEDIFYCYQKRILQLLAHRLGLWPFAESTP
ncbi:hypothetical protein [Desulfurispora thermophila]|uniref:hypothetical protein n=1 Tax=Desulfurispora thermophila TaxID=265470 RepID=UPI000381EB50|nr:hypothetical protein [Desulfurispora thermophila]